MFNKVKKTLAVSLSLVSVMSSMTAFATKSSADNLQENYYRFNNIDEAIEGWQFIQGNRYFFDRIIGMLVNSWKEDINGDLYYLGADGKAVTNQWYYHTAGHWYWLSADGKAVGADRRPIDENGNHLDAGTVNIVAEALGFQNIDGAYFCFDEAGERLTGWQNIQGNRYFFDQIIGMLVNSWQEDDNGNLYYLGADGKAVTNQWYYHTAGNWYWLDADGVAR